MANILAVDDEEDVRALLQAALARDGHTVKTLASGAAVTPEACRWADCILLDVMMPGEDGFATCARIRALAACPILFLTAKTQEADVLTGLGLGEDDYLAKPFRIAELRARVAAHLRRERRHMTASEVRFDGALAINYSDRTVTYDGQPVQFARREFDIIEFLSQNPGLVFDRERIYESVWGLEGEGDSSVIAEHIRRIRAKLAAAGSQKQYIETVWGVGYKWAK